MKVIIYGINYAPELTGIGRYSGEMGKQLAASGNTVSVVCASPYYPQWKVAEGYSAKKYQREKIGDVDVLRCPLYVPATVTTLRRLLHLFSFACSSWLGLLYSVLKYRPQIMIVVIPTLFCIPGALLIAKLMRIKAVLHIQDYELDAMLGLNMGGKLSVLGKSAGVIERFLFRRFDMVSTISYSMIELAQNKGVQPSRLFFFPNWVDTSFITPQASGQSYRERWKISDDEKVVLYSGNIGKKQGLEILIDVAERMQADRSLRFVVVGDGAYRDELIAAAKTLGLRNIEFHSLQPYEDLPSLLALADVHLVVQKRGAADVVLPSKLTAILSAGGHAVITADPNTELGKLCALHEGIAVLAEPENAAALVAGINSVLKRSDTQGCYNSIARNYAEKYLNRDAILDAVEGRWLATLNRTEAGF